MFCCDVLSRVVLCCTVLCCAVLCCVVLAELFQSTTNISLFSHSISAKAALPTTGAATIGSSGVNDSILDVTRLKRAMVHHTKKFAGYR